MINCSLLRFRATKSFTNEPQDWERVFLNLWTEKFVFDCQRRCTDSHS